MGETLSAINLLGIICETLLQPAIICFHSNVKGDRGHTAKRGWRSVRKKCMTVENDRAFGHTGCKVALHGSFQLICGLGFELYIGLMFHLFITPTQI